MKFIKSILATIMVVCTACCFTACEEETVEQVNIYIECYNGDDVYLESVSDYEYQNAQYSAISEASGSKAGNIAHVCKDYLKSYFKRILSSTDINNLKRHSTYWEITAKDSESGSVVDKATLKASEL